MERGAETEGGESINQWLDVGRVTALDTGVGPDEKRSRHIMLLPCETLLVPLEADNITTASVTLLMNTTQPKTGFRVATGRLMVVDVGYLGCMDTLTV